MITTGLSSITLVLCSSEFLIIVWWSFSSSVYFCCKADTVLHCCKKCFCIYPIVTLSGVLKAKLTDDVLNQKRLLSFNVKTAFLSRSSIQYQSM